jgi:hypothetical protein
LKKHADSFERMFFFFHGHEVLMINEVYPKPYDYMIKDGKGSIVTQDIYDKLKLWIWHHYLKKIAYKSEFIFVSNSLYKEFQKYVKLTTKDLCSNVHIINNSVGKIFEEKSYSFDCDKEYDFITIRNNMDSSTYCIDLICMLAEKNPDLKFLIIGKGKIFEHIQKPNNVTWINKFLQHDEMLKCINLAKCALMLTRRDTQGVMSCELVTYGIPLITSDLPVCREIFGNLTSVSYINNDVNQVDLKEIYRKALAIENKKRVISYSYENTVKKEEELICCK